MNNKFLGVVDSDSILYRVAASCSEETEEVAVDTLNAYLYQSIFHPTMCEKYIFCLSGGESGRSEIAVTKPYKGQRSGEKPEYLPLLKQYLIDEYKALVLDDYEADDLVVAICDQFSPYTTLIGIDKDAKQMAGSHYNFVKGEHFTLKPSEAHLHFYTQMLTGDTVDNIPGLPKVGAVKADKLFGSSNDLPPAYLARQLYTTMGFDSKYWLEQYQLLRMKKDIYYDWVQNFYVFKYVEQEETVNDPEEFHLL